MKSSHWLPIVILTSFAPLLHAVESKHTADYILSNPSEFEGKEVTVEVACVKPVQWKSSIPELAFFHATTYDRRNHKPDGTILVVIPAVESGHFAKKYGTEFHGKFTVPNLLKGTFLAAKGHLGYGNKRWVIDTTGQAAALIQAHKLHIPDHDADANHGHNQR